MHAWFLNAIFVVKLGVCFNIILLAKIPFRESPIADIRGLKLSSKVRDTRGLFAVRLSPRKSANNPAADFRGH